MLRARSRKGPPESATTMQAEAASTTSGWRMLTASPQARPSAACSSAPARRCRSETIQAAIHTRAADAGTSLMTEWDQRTCTGAVATSSAATMPAGGPAALLAST